MSDKNANVKIYTEENYNILNFDSLKIGLASPETILSWSKGEVTKSETINYRSLKPEEGGLFCEKIFGPTKDWECKCGKYKSPRYKGKICERCGVKVTKSKVRRDRMGHIELACPVSHIWYYKGTPSRIALLLDIPPKQLDAVLYFSKYIVIDPGETPLEKMDVLTVNEYDQMVQLYDRDSFVAKMGAEAIQELLRGLDLETVSEELKAEIDASSGQKKAKLIKRLDVVESFRLSQNKPEWMILNVLPVIPPDLRPMVQLDGGRFATCDLNDLYRRVINRNNRLKVWIQMNAPEVIIRNEKRMLQEAVDALIDNGRRGKPVTGPSNRELKSLSNMLKGKQGRFRQNLLGKRVDYSGRSVIVVGPELKMYQCGLPKEMALELFKPFVMKKLVDQKVMPNAKSAKRLVDKGSPEVWDALEIVIKDHPVMLNRAPTLHRLGIQAFEPILVEGRAIKLHPLVCTAFNADFDGDQMAVHVPLSVEAQAEARLLMLAANNLLKPADGKPVTVPTQDMVLGSYYLTSVREDEIGAGKVFSSEDEAVMAYEEGDIGLHAPIKIRMTKEVGGKSYTAIVSTTLGKVIFNRPVPQDLGFVKRDPSDPVSMVTPEIDFLVGKKPLGKIIERCINVHGTNIASGVLDKIKNQGYSYSTRSGITVSVFDATIPGKKQEYLASAQAQIDKIMALYKKGLYSEEGRYRAVIGVWTECTGNVSNELKSNMDFTNPIHMMVDSGARGSMSQLNQLAGMRGLIANTSGHAIEIPIKANYREGLNIIEYFISSRGARKGLADTALRTADSGYLTRRLVDVSQELVVREEDCHCTDGIWVEDIYGDGRIIEPLKERLIGRYLLHEVVNPETGEVIATPKRMLTEDDAQRIVDAGITRVQIRSLLTCDVSHGVCKKCYGKNLATGRTVSIGEAVGIIAAQSIGEPGTQLTMRTFHTGGVTTTSDITQGLPRVEELFEARKPKTCAILAEIGGEVAILESSKKGKIVRITGEDGVKEYSLHYDSICTVHEGDIVEKGAELTKGACHLQDILLTLGVDAVRNYLIREVQKTYRTQGVDVNDKHIEVIIRQMMRKVRIDDSGSTNLLPGAEVDKAELKEAREEARKRCLESGEVYSEPTWSPLVLGVAKAALASDSFISAASFQETTKVLTEAAIKGKTDRLLGLKENVIIGKLLPSGAGMSCYKNVTVRDNKCELNNVPEEELDDNIGRIIPI